MTNDNWGGANEDVDRSILHLYLTYLSRFLALAVDFSPQDQTLLGYGEDWGALFRVFLQLVRKYTAPLGTTANLNIISLLTPGSIE